MAKIPTILEAGRADGKLIKTNSVYDDNQNRFVSDILEDFNEFKEIIENHPGLVKASWCGKEECELKAKEVRGCKSRCIIGENHEDKCIFCGEEAKYDVWWGIQY